MFEPIIKDMPHIMHGGDYNPDQWLEVPEVLKEDVRLMKLAHLNGWTNYLTVWRQMALVHFLPRHPEQDRHGWIEIIRKY